MIQCSFCGSEDPVEVVGVEDGPGICVSCTEVVRQIVAKRRFKVKRAHMSELLEVA